MVVHAASIQDRDGGKLVVARLLERGWGRLKLIWADSGYAGQFVDWVKTAYGLVIEVVKRTEAHKFVVLPKRWIVERTFGWLGKYRRLSKDYETLPQSSEAMIYIAMINLMLHRLSPG